MTKIDVISGFLGAGKTTLIKKLLKESLGKEQVVLIENEFGEIGIDGGFLKEAGIEIREMNSGCICCSLVGDFETSLKEVMSKYAPDRIIIEPSGVGKLSDVVRAVSVLNDDTNAEFNSAVAVVDASKAKMYMKNFGEFYNDQIATAGTIILSRTGNMKQDKIEKAVELIRQVNATASIITTPWDQLQGDQIVNAMEGEKDSMALELLKEMEEEEHEHHHHHHHDDDEECCCGHHHHDDDDDDDDDDDEEEHEHHHHHHHHDDDDDECCCGHHHDDDDDDDDDEEEHEHHHHHHDDDEEEHEHHHHHHYDEDGVCSCGHHHDDDDDDDEEEHEHHHHHDHDEDSCGCGHHHHHHHHHADDVFASIGIETVKKYTKQEIADFLKALDDSERFGMILRAKGMVASAEGDSWIHFDYVPEETDIRDGAADITGKIVVIGHEVKEDEIRKILQ